MSLHSYPIRFASFRWTLTWAEKDPCRPAGHFQLSIWGTGQMTSEMEVVAQIMNQIANRVFAEVKKSPPPAQ